MTDPDEVIRAAEEVTGILESRGVRALTRILAPSDPSQIRARLGGRLALHSLKAMDLCDDRPFPRQTCISRRACR